MIALLTSLALLAPLPQETPGFDPLRAPLFGEHEDGTWVRTRTYKARFAPSGMTFVPFLGARAERNHPVSFRLASAVAGEKPLELARRGRVVRRGSEMTIDRGPVDVVYEVEHGSVEQVFRFDEGLPVGGDLTLELEVTTDLVGGRHGDGFLFHGPEGGATYGAAVAIDGQGRALRLASTLDEGRIRIEVPAWFVERAGGDLVVDPVIATWVTSDVVGSDSVNPDIAYDLSDDSFCTVVELAFSAGDSDIIAGITDPMGVVRNVLPIDSSNADIRFPQVAGLGATDQFLVVGERFDGPGGRHEIVGRIHSLQSDTTGPLLLIAGTGLFSTWTNLRPDVGGNSSTAGGTLFAVVFAREFLTGSLAGTTAGRVALVQPDGTVQTTRVIETDAGATLSDFAISKSTSDPNTVDRWNVAYVRQRTGDLARIRGVQLHPDGTLASPPATLLQFSSGTVPTGIDVSDGLPAGGGSSRYLVTYDNEGFIDGGVSVIVCVDNALRDLFNLRDKDGGSSLRRRRGASATITYEEFIVAYHEQQADGTWRARVTNLDNAGGDRLAAAEARASVGPPYSDPRGKVAVASRATGGAFSRWAGVTFSGRVGQSNRNRVSTGLFEASSPYSPAAQYCRTNGNSDGENGFLRFFGSRSASTTKTATAADLAPLQFALLVVGTGTDLVVGVGGGKGNLCIGGTIGRYNDQIRQIDGGGSVSFTVDPSAIPLGGSVVAASPGDSYYFQVWHRDVLPGGAPTSNLSNAAHFRFN